jgi:hypothetical protein
VHESAPKETSTSSLQRILFLLNLKHGDLVPNYLPMKLLAGREYWHLFVNAETHNLKNSWCEVAPCFYQTRLQGSRISKWLRMSSTALSNGP